MTCLDGRKGKMGRKEGDQDMVMLHVRRQSVGSPGNDAESGT
jgi:hypothetical protein